LNITEETEFESMAEAEMIEKGIREVEEEYTDDEEGSSLRHSNHVE
jgi:hypothetical protein